MKKVQNKKGFTLAELLVVVAILAILVAVAIPVFSGALNNAKTTAKNANARAVRAAAVTEILSNTTTYGSTGPWKATGVIEADGEMSSLTVEAWDSGDAEDLHDTDSATVEGTYIVKIVAVS